MSSNKITIKVRLNVKSKIGDRLLGLLDKVPFALQLVLIIPLIISAVLLLPFLFVWMWYKGVPIWVEGTDTTQKVFYGFLALFGWFLVINVIVWFFTNKTLFIWPLTNS